MTTNAAVAKRILQLLREKNMTQYRLEQQSGVYHGNMARILRHKNNTVTLATVYKLANGFHMSLMQFLDDDVFRYDEIDVE